MIRKSLDGVWNLMANKNPDDVIKADVPGTVYTALLKNKRMPDPYFEENQYEVRELSRNDYIMSYEFRLPDEMRLCRKLILRFEGIDTIAQVFFNGHRFPPCNNMHRVWEFDVTDMLMDEETQIVDVQLFSPIVYAEEKDRIEKLWGMTYSMTGYSHLRKAHYQFGWDWGPQLPDMGIWKSVSLLGINAGRIESVYHRQKHHSEDGTVDIDVAVNLADLHDADAVAVELVSPDGKVTKTGLVISDSKANVSISVPDPQLWYPNGYGPHPLYKLRVCLLRSGEVCDEKTMRIGLRTVEFCREKDAEGDGREFAFAVNGIKIFAMGANYIPEDQIVGLYSRERTHKLLRDCVAANYNMIRVWGGGIYGSDDFYEFCDEYGLLVWQDCMFACSSYSTEGEFSENVRQEIIDNVKRIRNHASLALWCGNNEIESAIVGWGLKNAESMKVGYKKMFEFLIPHIISAYDPETSYWPSSPSAGGGFINTNDLNKGDSHYWDVWHNFKPFGEYTKYKFRFCSEYGFESIPSMKTIRAITNDPNPDLMSAVMEAHQKCEAGTEKLMYYIAQMMNYPYNFRSLVYASQLVQADAIRLMVEQLRRNRGVCMGSLYWQVNDSNPVISWSSIDYFGRWKALHYYARKFYAPVIVSADMSTDPEKLVINVSSERQKELNALVRYRLRDNTGNVILSDSTGVTIEPLSAKDCVVLVKDALIKGERTFPRKVFLEIALVEKGAVLSESICMFVQPKEFEFLDPEISYSVFESGDRYRIELEAKNYAKGVCLDFRDHDVVFTDNWFDLYGNNEKKSVFLYKDQLGGAITQEMLREQLVISSYYSVMRSENKAVIE